MLRFKVPTPVAESVITPTKVIPVANNAELPNALKAILPGQAIELAAGNYSAMIGNNNGTETQHKYLIAKPGAVFVPPTDYVGIRFVNSSFWHLIGLDFQNSYININTGSHHAIVENCNFDVVTPLLNVGGIYISNQNIGGFRFINCAMKGKASTPQDPTWKGVYGICFQAGKDIGDNVYIAGNFIQNFWDGMTLGSMFYQKYSHGLIVESNTLQKMADDAIEGDGAHVDAIFRNNVIRDCIAGISLAPGGPGPILVEGNHITDCGHLPIKFNTSVAGVTQQITLAKNIVVRTGIDHNADADGCLFYWDKSLSGVKGVIVQDNIFIGRGDMLKQESPYNFKDMQVGFKRNRWWSTRELGAYRRTGAATDLFALFDPANNPDHLTYLRTFEEWKAYFPEDGPFAEVKLTPRALPGLTLNDAVMYDEAEVVPVPPPVIDTLKIYPPVGPGHYEWIKG